MMINDLIRRIFDPKLHPLQMDIMHHISLLTPYADRIKKNFRVMTLTRKLEHNDSVFSE